MKRILVIWICIVAQFVVAQNAEEARQEIWNLLKANNGDAYQMMMDLYKFPSEFNYKNGTISFSEATDFMTYVNGYDQRQLLADISTVVHECTHGYQSRKPMLILSQKNESNVQLGTSTVYYINKDEEYFVQETPTFPSIRIATIIPENLRFFRYDTYINTDQEILGTQQSGIYGLLEEWSAYLNGFQTSIRNINAYKKLGIEGFKGYFEDIGSIKITYPEFKYYMLTYLVYARKNEPNIYRQIVQNTAFKEAYHAIDKAFLKLLKTHEQNVQLIQSEVTKKGLDFELKDNYYWLGNNGIGAFQDEYDTLATAVKASKFKTILEDLKK